MAAAQATKVFQSFNTFPLSRSNPFCCLPVEAITAAILHFSAQGLTMLTRVTERISESTKHTTKPASGLSGSTLVLGLTWSSRAASFLRVLPLTTTRDHHGEETEAYAVRCQMPA